MRILNLLLPLGILAACSANAQIVLDSAGYPAALTGTDSIKVTTSSSSFPVLAAGANMTWDMNSITDSTALLFDYRVASTPYQYADSNHYIFSAYPYQGNVTASVKSAGLFNYGIVIPRVAYSLTPLTTGAIDTLIIPSQVAGYTSARKQIKFPATSGSSWTSSYNYDVSFLLTYAIAGDTLSPGIIRKHTIENDSVTGWGKMSIPDIGGLHSPFLNVLQVQSKVFTMDSFFLNGTPLTPILFTFFGLTVSGSTDTIYEQRYYRMGEVTPLAVVSFRDAAYTQPYKARTHVQRLSNVGVTDIARTEEIKVYPNPISGNKFFLTVSPGVMPCSYSVIDAMGNIVVSGRLQNSAEPIQLPNNTAAGNYLLQMNGSNGSISVTHIELCK